MTLVPTSVASVYAGDNDALRHAYTAAGRRAGNRDVVDTALLAPDEAAALNRYWSSCQQLWQAARDGKPLAGSGWVMTRRRVLQGRQSTAKGAKVDLNAELAALENSPGIAQLISAATDKEPNLADVRSLAKAAGGLVTEHPDRLELFVDLPVALLYPDALGGPAWPGEMRRSVHLELRHAAWRDRRVRRLAEVVVDVTEMWADPATAQDE